MMDKLRDYMDFWRASLTASAQEEGRLDNAIALLLQAEEEQKRYEATWEHYLTDARSKLVTANKELTTLQAAVKDAIESLQWFQDERPPGDGAVEEVIEALRKAVG